MITRENNMSSIILADDDELFRAIMKRHLTRMGFDVIEETSGKHVLAQIQRHHPVACLIDLVMDEKEGMETISEIQALPNKPKVIAVSSNPLYLEFAQTLGADAIVTKPVAEESLRATLKQLGVVTS